MPNLHHELTTGSADPIMGYPMASDCPAAPLSPEAGAALIVRELLGDLSVERQSQVRQALEAWATVLRG